VQVFREIEKSHNAVHHSERRPDRLCPQGDPDVFRAFPMRGKKVSKMGRMRKFSMIPKPATPFLYTTKRISAQEKPVILFLLNIPK